MSMIGASPEDRLPLWRAYAEFFLDTEIDECTFAYVARTVAESGLSPIEAEAVLWNEVFPVLHTNLRNHLGVWDGWPDEWLLANLRIASGPAVRSGPRAEIAEIERCWKRMCAHWPGHERA
jgi:hypothetical protein